MVLLNFDNNNRNYRYLEVLFGRASTSIGDHEKARTESRNLLQHARLDLQEAREELLDVALAVFGANKVAELTRGKLRTKS